MERLGVPRRIVSFILPMGYSFNLDGSTLYLSLAAVFVAQASNHPLTFGQQLLMLLTLMLTTKGIAAVPRASLVVLSGTLATFGLPLEGIAVILGVDELMDMARTFNPMYSATAWRRPWSHAGKANSTTQAMKWSSRSIRRCRIIIMVTNGD